MFATDNSITYGSMMKHKKAVAEVIRYDSKSAEPREKKPSRKWNKMLKQESKKTVEELSLLTKTRQAEEKLTQKVEKCQAEIDDLDIEVEKMPETKFVNFINDH